ncbi:MAG: restriction endonuclease subunit S, partial [Acidobacteriota bacterium]|nr:restriction endonuclease subunit S [Acidobacteriota bacterium]
NSPRKLAETGDILVSVRAPVGDVNIAPIECCIGRGLAALRGTKIHNDYLYFVMNYFKDTLVKIGQGSTFEAINKRDIFELKIPFPTISEQKKIAEVLLSVDEAIDKKQEIIEKTKMLKKGLMQELFTHGIGHKKFKETEIGKIPVDWEVVKIEDTCEVVGGSTPSTNVKEFWNGGINWAIPTDITKLKGNLISSTEKSITERGLSNCAAKILPIGSILLTSRATIGECAINLKPMATNQGFASLICKDKVYNWFVFYRIKYMRKEIERLGNGSTFNEVSKKSIRGLKILIPLLSEQKKIAEILTSVDEVIEKEMAQKERIEKIKKGLMQVLLTGKIRVKI